jgi:hypothetical protein
MEAIGGYFSLELPLYEEYHKNAIRLNTGRNCLEYILRARKYSKVYIPYYTCEVVLEPFQKLNISYAFYHINQHFELSENVSIEEGEALLYTNYYGLKQRYVEELSEKYGNQLIVDNTQAFFAKPIGGIDTFYTCRKFLGVPDGAYLYTDAQFDDDLEQDVSYERMAHLLKRIDLSAEEGFADFRKADDSLDNQPICKMSKLTERMMRSIDYTAVKERRRENFRLLHEALESSNQMSVELDGEAVPMVYPYMTDKAGLREHLIKNKVFVAKYWPNVLEWTEKKDAEYDMANLMLAIPVDQRYSGTAMNKIIEIISRYG